jgi:hypothetical protein
MAKQKGIIKLDGTISDITFLKTKDGYIAKEKSSISGARIASDPAFQRTRENGAEFGRAGKAGKLLRHALRAFLQNASDGRMVSRLTKEMLRVIRADATSARGLRNVIDGEAEMLEGFDFNIEARFSTCFYAPFTAAVDRFSGIASLQVPSFIPAQMVAAPAGTTHYQLSVVAALVDFELQSFVIDTEVPVSQPWDATATAALAISLNVTPASTHPIFIALGVSFFQEVNGVQYPLRSGAFNAMALVKVNGG